MPVPEVGSDDDVDGTNLTHEDLAHEVLGTHAGHLLVEPQDVDVVGTCLLEQLAPATYGRQMTWSLTTGNHRHRVRVEGDGSERHSALDRPFARHADEGLMTEMHSIEYSDGGYALFIRWHG